MQLIKPPSWAEREPAWLKRLREAGAMAFLELPYESNPLYVKHNENPSLDLERISSIVEPDPDATVPGEYETLYSSLNEPIIIHVDGTPVASHVPATLAEKGLVVKPLVEALKTNEDEIRKILQESGLKPHEDKFVGLLFAALNSGIYVKVPSNISGLVKVRSIWLLRSADHATCAATLILAEPGAEASIIEEYKSFDGEKDKLKFISHLILADCRAESSIKHSLINSLDTSSEALVYKLAVNRQYARNIWVGGLIGGSLTKYKVNNMLIGDGCRSDSLEVVMASESQRFDMTINLNHVGKFTTGRVLAKGVSMDRSRMILKGIIRIEKQAKNTSAYLAEHAMLLSPEARADAIPGLEIESDNVKATHSASVAQVDQEQLWYLMSRGIDREGALKMITLGFFEPIISEIDVTEIRWNIRYLLEKKWLGPRGEELDPVSLMDVYVEPEDVGKPIEDIFGTHYKYLRRQ